jgi:hypothetical protein
LASIINSTDTGSGGLITTGDSSDELQLQTAETTAITITSGQQSVFIAGTAAAPAVTTTGDLNTGIYFPAADNIGFTTGGTIRGRWTTDGLCFGSDTAAANALDDYEEGTWTPVFEGTVNPSGLSLGNTDATYTKIGNSVRLSLNVTVSNIGTGGSGGMKVTGLPFTASSAMDFQPCTTESEGLLASVSNFVPIIEGNTTSILLYAGWNGTGGPTQLAWGTNAKNGMIFRVSVVYHAA